MDNNLFAACYFFIRAEPYSNQIQNRAICRDNFEANVVVNYELLRSPGFHQQIRAADVSYHGLFSPESEAEGAHLSGGYQSCQGTRRFVLDSIYLSLSTQDSSRSHSL